MGDAGEGRARVTLSGRSLWRVRLGRELPRYLVCGLSIAGILASARFAIAPPRPVAGGRERPATPMQDLAAEGYAQLFARAYLTWEASDPEAHRLALDSFVGTGMEPDAGLQLPADGEERVAWTEVVQERVEPPEERVYTVAAQTDTAGLVYLSVSVARGRDGGLRLAGYPAFVGAPASDPADVDEKLREADEPALQTVVERALRNYLAASSVELAADLSPGARVSLPARGLTLESVQRVDWSPEGADVVTALVRAQDGRGVLYTLAYELDMTLVVGRWEVSAIQTDPDT
jgi:hypothetical protein